MEYLNEDHLKQLLQQEWLVRIDNDKSTPYLLKFYASTKESSCCLVITDTKNVWGEVLSGKAFARRWRECNPSPPTSTSDDAKEIEWRGKLLELLTNVHSIGGIADLSFDIVPSTNADFAFELGSDELKWRWETYSLGPRVSADVLSKQLIMPLISVSHLAFSSADPVSELSDANLEMATDKAGRTGRRAVDTHVKHAISRPRLTTTMRRMSAVFNFLPDLSPIVSKVEPPNFIIPSLQVSEPPSIPTTSARGAYPRTVTPESSTSISANKVTEEQITAPSVGNQVNVDPESATEDEEDSQPPPPPKGRDTTDIPAPRSTTPVPFNKAANNPNYPCEAPPKVTAPSAKASTSTKVNDGSDSQEPQPPKKKPKRKPVSSSSDEDSEAERKRHVAQTKTASRGAKQPIKRGGRRF